MKPKLISIFCMFLIVLIPVSTSAQFRDLNEPLRLAEKVQQERITEEQLQLEEDLIGEDIVVEVDSYQPRILKSNLLEESDVKVYALLKGITSNPTVEISNIRNVAVRVLNITTDPENKPVTIGGITYIKPQAITFDNLGYLQIPIRKIPRQDDVPDNIDIAINARLYFDVSEGLTASRFDDFLLPQRHDEWSKESENHRFFAGYIRASEILTDQAAFVLYDTNKKEVDKLTLKDGQTSGVISNRIYSPYGGIFDKYRIKLNSVRGLTKIAHVYILKDNELIKRTLSEGQELYPGSKWVIRSIVRLDKENKVVLERQDGLFSILFSRYLETSFPDWRFGSDLEQSLENIRSRQNTKTNPREATLSLTPTSLNTAGLTSDESDKIEELNKRIKEAASNDKALDSIKEELKTELNKEIKENYRNALIVQLKQIFEYYLDKGIKITSSEKPADREELSRINSRIEEISLLIGKPSSKITLETMTIPQTSEQAYAVSVREFEKLLNEYPDINDEQGIPYAVKALEKIGEINLKYLNRHQKASEAYKRLIEEYPEYVKEKISDYELLISFLDEVVKRDADSIQIYESDDQKPIIVTLFDITQPEIEPTAALSVDNKIFQDLREGEIIQDLANDILLWKVLEIKPESILIEAREPKTEVVSTVKTQVIELQKNKQLQIPMSTNQYEKEKNPDKLVRLISTKIQRAASITIMPEPERAFSDSDFNLHLTIDKAALSPPIFTDSLGDEISRTQNLLNKLNNIIAKVEKIQNFWTKFCFVTFGALWAKNLLFGGKATLARQKLTPRWKEKYTDALSQGYKKSYDAFIQEHKEEYNKEFELSNQLITDIKTNQYQSKLPDHIKNLGPDYEELKKDYYYSTQFARANPQDKVVMREAIELDASLVKTALDNEIAQFQNKNYNELPNDVRVKIRNIIESTLKYKIILESSKDKEKEKGIEDIYNTPTDRREIIDIYRTLESKKRYEDYFKNKKYQSIGATDEHEDIAFSLKETYLPSTTTNVAKISTSRVIIKEDENGKKVFWLDSFGNEHEITLQDDKPIEEQIDIGSNVNIEGSPAQLTAGDSKQQFSHIPRATYYDSGKDKGRVNRISIDDLRYAEVEYSTTGRISNIEVYERADPNSELGLSTDIRAGDLNSVLASAKESNDLELQNKIKNMNSCISRLNTKLIQNSRGNKFQTYGLNCPSDSYAVSPTTEPFNKQSCTDFMSPGDCKLLFNACDPVICPASRCNFGGRVQTDNVVQSGLVGSILYCLPNYKEGVVMPICLTGLLAALQNIRSILEGYTQCLKRAKVSGEYVGICDRLRSFYLCDMITKEAVAILNIKGGLLSILSEKFFDKGSGGGEYASFKQNVENSVDTLKFFTQDYAKNVFAQYSGKGLPELGTEICKNLIYGKGPDLGNLFNQAARPESPPQFTAFFDETPLTDITEPPLSHYSIFYHIYAGESEEIGYSVYLRGILGDVLTKRPIFIIRSKRIPAGGFASENIDKQLPSGFNQICVELKSRIYGVQTKCGYGKATTSFAIEELNNLFISNEITQKIDSEEECVPEQSRITTISSQDSSLLNGISLKTPISAFSPGLTQTGILRKCSSFSPGVGSNTDSWVEIGTCGKDKLGRDLGICWLYKPSVNLITDSEIREVAEKGLEKTRSELSETLDIKNLVSDPEASGLIARAQTLVQTGKIERDKNKIDLAVDAYREVVLYSVSRSLAAKAQFELANAYMVRAEIMSLKSEIPREDTEAVKKDLNLNEKEKDRTAPEIELVGIAKDLTATEVKKSDKESQKIQIKLKDESKLIRVVIYINDESFEGSEFKNDDGNLDKIYDLDLSKYMDKILPNKLNLLTILAVDEFGNENKYSINLILKE